MHRGVVDQAPDRRLVVAHAARQHLGAGRCHNAGVVVAFGDVDADEHLDVDAVGFLHGGTPWVRGHSQSDAPGACASTTLRPAPRACPCQRSQAPDRGGRQHLPGHLCDRGIQPYPPRRATSPDTATPEPLNKVKGRFPPATHQAIGWQSHPQERTRRVRHPRSTTPQTPAAKPPARSGSPPRMRRI